MAKTVYEVFTQLAEEQLQEVGGNIDIISSYEPGSPAHTMAKYTTANYYAMALAYSSIAEKYGPLSWAAPRARSCTTS